MKHQAGVTLIELLICVALLAIVLNLSVSGFSYLRESQTQQVTRENLSSSLSSARQAAVTHRLPVYMCPSSDGSACSTAKSDWTNGWIIFVDVNDNKSFDADTDIKLLANKNKASKTAKVITDMSIVSFKPNGIVSNAEFQVCSTFISSENQKISIGPLGLVKKESSSASCS